MQKAMMHGSCVLAPINLEDRMYHEGIADHLTTKEKTKSCSVSNFKRQTQIQLNEVWTSIKIKIIFLIITSKI
jgi:hypothetical protein